MVKPSFAYRLAQVAMVSMAIMIDALPEPLRQVYLIGFLLELLITEHVCFAYILMRKPPPILSAIVQAQLWPAMLVIRAVVQTRLIIKRRRAVRPS